MLKVLGHKPLVLGVIFFVRLCQFVFRGHVFVLPRCVGRYRVHSMAKVGKCSAACGCLVVGNSNKASLSNPKRSIVFRKWQVLKSYHY
ncbi:hypothetical protein F5Y08DRAFT_89007 [Xylaria arbuscula]|nr:hypothetical protein F5Y08DRAFT_89007 [Xylaria arbuscula]